MPTAMPFLHETVRPGQEQYAYSQDIWFKLTTACYIAETTSFTSCTHAIPAMLPLYRFIDFNTQLTAVLASQQSCYSW